MDLTGLDTAAIARSLAQVADRPGDFADAFFERLEVVELDEGPLTPQLSVRDEWGFALRLLRNGHCWLASRDRVDSEAFGGALRQVARAVPRAPYPSPSFPPRPAAPSEGLEGLLTFPTRLTRALRRHHAAFPLQIVVRRHWRSVQWVGTRVATEPQSERYFSVVARTPWGSCGRLLIDIDDEAVDELTTALLQRFAARDAEPPAPGRTRPLLLGPAAAAILLHEAIAHALETDTLALVGDLDAATGKRLGGDRLSVLDDPSAAPEAVRRTVDDEGSAAVSRWLLRGGAVGQPLADLAASRSSEKLLPGAGRRGNRHQQPAPRSTYLQALPGDVSLDELLGGAEGGLLVEEIDRGRLDPLRGEFLLEAPCARTIEDASPAAVVGRLTIRGAVGELAGAVRAVGSQARLAGAGWCAKGGVLLPVWASTPPILLHGLEITP